MKKKHIIIGVLLIALVAACIAILVVLTPKKLPRDLDTEFDGGTSIRIEELTDMQAASLYKLCKIWGYVKYYHPSVIDGTLNWDAELFRVMPKVLEADTEEEANDILYTWLAAFPADETASTEEGAEWVKLQEEAGFSVLDTSWIADTAFLGEDLCGYLETLSHITVADRSNAYAAFDKRSPYVNFDNERQSSLSPEDDGMKLLSLFRFWNIYEYYSPNVEITITDWDTVLKEAIPNIIAAEDEKDYVLAIAEVTAQTGDAHISLRDPKGIVANYYGKYFLPCSFKTIDGQVVVWKTSENGTAGLKPGDVITEIDGISIEERIATLSQYTALPEPDKFVNALSASLLKTEGEQAEVKVIRNGEALTLSVTAQDRFFRAENPYKNGLMENGEIGYIDPSALKQGELEKLMEQFADTKGIIVDLRYYPSVFIPYLLGEYITPEPTQFVIGTFPNRAVPGSFYRDDTMRSGAGMMAQMGGKREYPSYDGKVIILMDETSQSQSEFTVMALRQSPNAVVIGSPSIGADGNIVSIFLPGGIRFAMTGLGIYTPDGGQTQRVGLQPDIECCPTIEGVRDGRDELIEKAVELIG